MADINALFALATEEAESFADDGARAHQSVDQLLRLAAALADAVEGGAAEARQRLQLLSTRLLDGEQDLVKENGAALGALAALRSASGEVQGRVDGYLALVHARLADVRGEKERLAAEMQQQGEAVQEHAGRYAEHVREVQAASRARLAAARQVVAAFREMVDSSRASLEERRDALLLTLKQMETNGRQRLEYVLQAYDAVAAVVQDQVGELQGSLRTLTDQAVSGLARRLSQDVLGSLEAAADPLRQAISDLDRFCRDSREACGDRLQDIASRIEDLTTVLERLRQPLDLIRQQLQ